MKNISDVTRGAIFMGVAILLFLNTLGMFKESFTLAFRVLAILLFAYGFYIGDYWLRIEALLRSKK